VNVGGGGDVGRRCCCVGSRHVGHVSTCGKLAIFAGRLKRTRFFFPPDLEF
jgi:ABC-type phosphonate transport system ATPase subunit